MRRKKLSRHEKKDLQRARVESSLAGTGRYLYENNTDSDLSLPKPTQSGTKFIGPRKRFEGDSYYMKWVGHPMNLLRLIEKMVDVKEEKETIMQEKKLILDQPDTVTNQGKVEHVVDDQTPRQKLHDSTEAEGSKKPDVLLNESPVDGVEIILG